MFRTYSGHCWLCIIIAKSVTNLNACTGKKNRYSQIWIRIYSQTQTAHVECHWNYHEKFHMQPFPIFIEMSRLRNRTVQTSASHHPLMIALLYDPNATISDRGNEFYPRHFYYFEQCVQIARGRLNGCDATLSRGDKTAAFLRLCI